MQQSVTLVRRVLAQKRNDKGKVHGLHEPQVDCIAKGKRRHRYEFGTKVSVTTIWPDNLVVGMASLPSNLYDGHTLGGALRQVVKPTGVHPREVYVDRGYRGHGVEDGKVYIAAAVRKRMQRRNAVEPISGHLKAAGRLGHCPLKGIAGDASCASLCGCGQNSRLILRCLQDFLRRFSLGRLRLPQGCFATSAPVSLVRVLALPV